MIFVAAILFIIGALKAATWITAGPSYWFWFGLAFAAWCLAGVIVFGPTHIGRRE